MFSTKTPRNRLRTSAIETPSGSVGRRKTLDHHESNNNQREYSTSPSVPMGSIVGGRFGSPAVARVRTPGSSIKILDSSFSNMTPTKSQSLSSLSVPQQMYLLKDQIHSLVHLTYLPAEVEELLRSLNLEVDDVNCILDYHSGYCVIATYSRCFVWQGYKKSLLSNFSMIQEFPIPQHEQSFLKAPLLSIVPPLSQDPKQSGLLMCTHDGQIRFWDNLEYGSSNFMDQYLDISKDEFIVSLVNSEPAGHLVSTTYSNLFKVALYDNDARPVISILPVSENKGLFGFSQKIHRMSIVEHEFVSACAGPLHEGKMMRDVFVMTRTHLEKWTLQRGQGDKLHYTYHLHQLISDYLARDLEGKGKDLFVQLIDIKLTRQKTCAVLVSYSIEDIWTYYAIFTVYVEDSTIGEILKKTTLLHRYQNPNQDMEAAQLLLPDGGPLALVVFPYGIVMKLIDQDLPFEKSVIFKNPGSNRLLGVGASTDLHSMIESTIEFGMLLAESGVVATQFNITQARSYHIKEDDFEDKTKRLSETIEQAVTYGMSDKIVNPIHFDISSMEGNLDQSTEELSNLILNTLPSSGIANFSHLLNERFKKLDNIIHFINVSGRELSEHTRTTLLFNSEKALGVVQLWAIHEQNLRSRKSYQILEVYLRNVLRQIKVQSKDSVHTFYQYYSKFLGDFFALIKPEIQQIETLQSIQETSEINKIILCVLKNTKLYRTQSASDYKVHPFSLQIDAWDSSSDIIVVLEQLLQVTQKAIYWISNQSQNWVNEMEQDNEESPNQLFHILREQFCGLLDVVIGSYLTLIGTLERNKAPAQDLSTVRTRFESIYRQFLHALVDLELSSEAYELCERYKLFDILVEFALKDKKELDYLQLYGKEFAFVLCNHYIRQGMFKELLDQDESYNAFLSEYFVKADLSHLQWIHDVRVGDFKQAHRCLLSVSSKEKDATKKKTCVNLSKLAYLADIDLENIDDEPVVHELEVLQKETDFISIQELSKQRFNDAWKDEASAVFGDQRSQIQWLLSTFYNLELGKGSPRKKENPVTFMLRNHLSQLLDNRVLYIEAYIDVLTLNKKEPTWFTDAIEVYDFIASDQPELLARIWRRAFLQTDWPSIIEQCKKMSNVEGYKLIRETATYKLIEKLHQVGLRTIPSAESVLVQPTSDGAYPQILQPNQETFQKILRIKDMEESKLLKNWIDKYQMENVIAECQRVYSLEHSV